MTEKQKPVEASVPNYDDVPGVPESSGEGWHSDLPRVKFEALLGREIIIEETASRDSIFVEEGKLQKQYLLLRFRPTEKAVLGEFDGEAVTVEPGEEATTSTGGVRVVDQLSRVQAFPVKCVLAREKTANGRPIWSLKAKAS